MRSLNKTLEFASTSRLDPKSAVFRVSEAAKAYRLLIGDAEQDAKVLTQVMDLLTTMANQSSQTVQESAEALIQYAPQATTLGLSIRQAARDVTAFAEIGRKGTTGGNEFTIAMRDLSNKAIENRQEFERLGLQLFDVNGQFLDTVDAIGEMNKVFGHLSTEQAVIQLQKLGVQQRATRFILQAMAAEGLLRQIKTEFDDVDGAVDRLHRESMTQLVLLTNEVRTSFESLINTNVVGYLERIAGQIRHMDDAFPGFNQETILQDWREHWGSPVSPIITAFKALTGVHTPIIRDIQEAAEEIDLLVAETQQGMSAIAAARQEFVAEMRGVYDSILDRGFYRQFNEILQPGFANLADAIDTATLDDIERARDRISGLNAQIEDWITNNHFLDMDDRDIRDYFRSLKEEADAAARSLRELQTHDLQSLSQDYESLRDRLQTPVEQAIGQVNRMLRMRQVGIEIEPLLEARAVNQILTDLEREFATAAESRQIRVNAAAEIRGSQAEFSSRVAVKLEDSDRTERRNQHVEQLQELRKQNVSLGELNKTMKDMRDEQRKEERVKLGIW